MIVAKIKKFNVVWWQIRSLLSIKKLIAFIISILLYIFFSALYLNNINSCFSISDFILYTFLGYGQGYFDSFEFLRLIVMNILPLYFICIYCADDGLKNNAVVFRLSSPRKWIRYSQISYFFLFFLFIIINIIFCFIVGGLFNKQFTDYQYMNDYFIRFNPYVKSPFAYIIIEGTLRISELMLIQAFFLCALALTKNVTVSFLIAVFPYVGLLFRIGKFFPYGSSSLYRIWNFSSNTYLAYFQTLLFLIVLYFMLYIYLSLFGYKKLFN